MSMIPLHSIFYTLLSKVKGWCKELTSYDLVTKLDDYNNKSRSDSWYFHNKHLDILRTLRYMVISKKERLNELKIIKFIEFKV